MRLELRAAFAKEVARFVLSVLGDVFRFLRGGLRDLAPAVRGRRGHFAGFVLGGVRRRRRRLAAGSLCHLDLLAGEAHPVPPAS
ncbi:hypothetical protein ACWEVP_37915 [Amycolatopsis sp. NPDC003865]